MHSWPDPNARWRRTVFREQPLPQATTDEAPSPGGRFAFVAFLLFMASQTTRWGWWIDIGNHTHDVGYLGQSVDGLGGAMAAGGLALVIRARSGASSGFRIVQYLPFLLGLAALLLAGSGFQQAYVEMSAHRADGRPADMDAGAWLALIGGILGFAAGLLATGSRLRHPVHRDAPAVPLRSFARDMAIGALGAPIWLLAWLSAGQIGGMWLGMFGVLFSPILSIGIWRWMRGDGQTPEERVAVARPVPMDRLRDEGSNR